MKKKGAVDSEYIKSEEPLYTRYLEFDYPESDSEEIKQTEFKFQKLIQGAAAAAMSSPSSDIDDDAMKDFMNMDLDNWEIGSVKKEEEEEKKKVPLEKKPKIKKEKEKEEEKKTDMRFTAGRGLFYSARMMMYALGCFKNTKYANFSKDVPEHQIIMTDRTIFKQFEEFINKQKELLLQLMTAENPNESLVEFIELLQKYPIITCTELSDDEDGGINAWSGSNIDGRVRVSVYQEDAVPMGVFVNKEQATILTILHAVTHCAIYLHEIVQKHIPAGMDHSYLELWETKMAIKNGKEPDIRKWNVKGATPFETQLMDLFAAINISNEWIKRHEKKMKK